MLKLTLAMLAVALVGSAGAEEWRLDAGSDEVVRIPDPTGHKAKRYRAEYYYARAGERVGAWPAQSPPPFSQRELMPVYGTAYRGLRQTADGY